MAQSTILAAGKSAASSSTFTVAAGESATVSIRSATPGESIPAQAILPVMLVQSVGSRAIGTLTRDVFVHVVSGAGTYRVDRSDLTDFGVDVEVLLDT